MTDSIDSIKLTINAKNFDSFCCFVQSQVNDGETVEDAVRAFIESKPKIPGEGEGVIVILNYGPKSHAIFGADTKPVKDELMALNTPKKIVAFNSKLEYGSGWVVMDKTKLKTVLAVLDENDILYGQIEKAAFDEGERPAAKVAPKKKSVPPKAKSTASKKAVPPKATAKKTVGKAKVAAVEDEDDTPDLSGMTLAQLKTLAKEAGLPQTGTKDNLIERIEKHRSGANHAASAGGGEDEETPGEDEGKRLSKMKIEELKELLREEELSTTGAKDVLITRLLNHQKGNRATPAKGKGKAVAAKGAKSVPAAKGNGPVKVKAKVNAQGNHVEEETGLVFIVAPVGKGGRDLSIAVGVQNPDSEEQGLGSVNPLDDEMIEVCERRKWTYLKDDMMSSVEKKNPEMFEELTALLSRRDGEATDEKEDEASVDVEEEE